MKAMNDSGDLVTSLTDTSSNVLEKFRTCDSKFIKPHKGGLLKYLSVFPYSQCQGQQTALYRVEDISQVRPAKLSGTNRKKGSKAIIKRKGAMLRKRMRMRIPLLKG